MSLAYDYYPAILYAIEQISQGQTLTKACDVSNIGIGTFKNWIKDSAELTAQYDEAVQRGHDAMAEALINIDNNQHHRHSDPKMAKVVSDNIKWYLAKKKPKEFGHNVSVEVSGSIDLAIVNALEAAKNRVAELAAPEDLPPIIDITPMTDDEVTLAEILG